MKVHFVGTGESTLRMLRRAGVNYLLESFFTLRKQRSPRIDLWDGFKHVIVDSGLFTIMYGAGRDTPFGYAEALAWQDEIVAFARRTPAHVSFVEVDVQRIISVDAAWELRRRLRADLPGRSIMNVYHLDDGNPDALVDFADYIGISQPELKARVSDAERHKITTYIARRAERKGKRVHMLGLTHADWLRRYAWCYSCDSTSWTNPFRYGVGRSVGADVTVSDIRAQPMPSFVQKPESHGERDRFWAATHALATYARDAGPQD